MKRKLTPSEFEEAVKRLPRRLTARNIEIVREILVGGRKQIDLIHETGLSRTAISAMTKKVREAHQLYGKLPEGWERIEVVLPTSMVSIVRAMEEEAKKLALANGKGEQNGNYGSIKSEGRRR